MTSVLKKWWDLRAEQDTSFLGKGHVQLSKSSSGNYRSSSPIKLSRTSVSFSGISELVFTNLQLNCHNDNIVHDVSFKLS